MSLSIPPENRFSDIFRGYRKKPVAWNRLTLSYIKTGSKISNCSSDILNWFFDTVLLFAFVSFELSYDWEGPILSFNWIWTCCAQSLNAELKLSIHFWGQLRKLMRVLNSYVGWCWPFPTLVYYGDLAPF